MTEEREIIEQYQTHGSVLELADEGLFRIKRKDGSIFLMPYDPESITATDKELYRAKVTREIIKDDPDFLMTWEIVTWKNDNLEDVKLKAMNGSQVFDQRSTRKV